MPHFRREIHSSLPIKSGLRSCGKSIKFTERRFLQPNLQPFFRLLPQQGGPCFPQALSILLVTVGVHLVPQLDLFRGSQRVETVVLLSKLNTKQHIEVELNLDELDLTAAESKATYDEIKAYVLEKYGLKVSSLYISQVKRKCGMDVGQNYNLSKKEDAKVPQCPPEKEAAIMDALKHFQMIM